MRCFYSRRMTMGGLCAVLAVSAAQLFPHAASAQSATNCKTKRVGFAVETILHLVDEADDIVRHEADVAAREAAAIGAIGLPWDGTQPSRRAEILRAEKKTRRLRNQAPKCAPTEACAAVLYDSFITYESLWLKVCN